MNSETEPLIREPLTLREAALRAEFRSRLPDHLRPQGEMPTIAEAIAICNWYKDEAAARAAHTAAASIRVAAA
jgi:hypothetical protein